MVFLQNCFRFKQPPTGKKAIVFGACPLVAADHQALCARVRAFR
jgi:hypothetical protein